MIMPVNLDPTDWDEFRQKSHAALDLIIDDLMTLRERPVWTKAPDSVLTKFQTALPRQQRDLEDVLTDFDRLIRPYVTGNRHPLFMGWVHGAGTPVGMVAEMLAAGLNANCGGRDHIGIEVERQITRWVAEMTGLPEVSSGLFLTGSSIANFLGLLVARTRKIGKEVRVTGLGAHHKPLTAYTSSEAHQCIRQAMEMSGIGSQNLRCIPTDADKRLRSDLLISAIDADIKAGLRPFLIIGTSGTVNTGAIDPLDEIADIAANRDIWFHVDGAIGATAMLSPSLRRLMKGIERADSIALDFHKLTHVPYDAGFLIVRDPAVHLETFKNDAAYLSRAGTGLAAGEVWPSDLGPDLSRGFRALKTWFTFQTFGTDKIAQCIDQNCAVAQYLSDRLTRNDLFEISAPVRLNIVCFSAKTKDPDAMNRSIVEYLQNSGQAAPSTTYLDGHLIIRAAIVNHRTTPSDMDLFVAAAEDFLLRAGSAPAGAL